MHKFWQVWNCCLKPKSLGIRDFCCIDFHVNSFLYSGSCPTRSASTRKRARLVWTVPCATVRRLRTIPSPLLPTLRSATGHLLPMLPRTFDWSSYRTTPGCSSPPASSRPHLVYLHHQPYCTVQNCSFLCIFFYHFSVILSQIYTKSSLYCSRVFPPSHYSLNTSIFSSNRKTRKLWQFFNKDSSRSLGNLFTLRNAGCWENKTSAKELILPAAPFVKTAKKTSGNCNFEQTNTLNILSSERHWKSFSVLSDPNW